MCQECNDEVRSSNQDKQAEMIEELQRSQKEQETVWVKQLEQKSREIRALKMIIATLDAKS